MSFVAPDCIASLKGFQYKSNTRMMQSAFIHIEALPAQLLNSLALSLLLK
jgi:hypothetical protein